MIVTLHSAPADLRGFKLSLWDWRSWPQLHLCVEFVDKSCMFWATPAFCEMIGLRFEIISCPTLTPHTPPKRTSSRGMRIKKILWSKQHNIRIKRKYYQDQTKTILREGRKKEGRKDSVFFSKQTFLVLAVQAPRPCGGIFLPEPECKKNASAAASVCLHNLFESCNTPTRRCPGTRTLREALAQQGCEGARQGGAWEYLELGPALVSLDSMFQAAKHRRAAPSHKDPGAGAVAASKSPSHEPWQPWNLALCFFECQIFLLPWGRHQPCQAAVGPCLKFYRLPFLVFFWLYCTASIRKPF